MACLPEMPTSLLRAHTVRWHVSPSLAGFMSSASQPWGQCVEAKTPPDPLEGTVKAYLPLGEQLKGPIKSYRYIGIYLYLTVLSLEMYKKISCTILPSYIYKTTHYSPDRLFTVGLLPSPWPHPCPYGSCPTTQLLSRAAGLPSRTEWARAWLPACSLSLQAQTPSESGKLTQGSSVSHRDNLECAPPRQSSQLQQQNSLELV